MERLLVEGTYNLPLSFVVDIFAALEADDTCFSTLESFRDVELLIELCVALLTVYQFSLLLLQELLCFKFHFR